MGTQHTGIPPMLYRGVYPPDPVEYILYNAHAVNRRNIKYGYLYNAFVIDPEFLFAPDGWHVATTDDWTTLNTYLATEQGRQIKEVGFTHWNTGNGYNSVGFNARGTGVRSGVDGTFSNQKSSGFWWCEPSGVPGFNRYAILIDVTGVLTITTVGGSDVNGGGAVRYVKDDSNDIGYMVGNDGTVYPTIKLNNNQVWTACDSIETKDRNGDPILKLTDAGDWILASTGAYCAYDNDEGNALQGVFGIAGWHVPTESELNTLAGEIFADTSVFKPIPVGVRGTDGSFTGSDFAIFIWGDEFGITDNNDMEITIPAGCSSESSPRNHGFDVRLIKNDSNFVTSVTDIDGNTYKTVKIGDQVWMLENFRCKHYTDGTPIAYLPKDSDWAADTQGAYCRYGVRIP